jgi:SPP1 family predicted phage head-tail adaptor
VQAGKLDRRVTILQRSLARDEYGEQVEAYDELATVWAQKLDITGREFFASQKVIGEGTARFRVRYRTDIDLVDRLSYDGHQYDIKQLVEIGRRDELEIIATRRVP